jgi:hypothetical protein
VSQPDKLTRPSPDAETGRPSVPPVFVGGTGRSGTTITARLIAAQSQFALIPSEFRFHVNAVGLPGLLAGRTGVQDFVAAVRKAVARQEGGWSSSVDREEGKLWKFVRIREIDPLLDELEATFDQDRIAAMRRFVASLFGVASAREGTPSWVEMSLLNVAAAPTLITLFPDAKFVHSVRDGRDVVCSRLAKNPQQEVGHGINRWMEHWQDMLLRADLGARYLPESQLFLFRFEDLVLSDREGTLARLLGFLGVEEDEGVRGYFDCEMLPDRANIGRWAKDLSDQARTKLSDHYARSLDELREAGISPGLDALLPGSPSVRPTPASVA